MAYKKPTDTQNNLYLQIAGIIEQSQKHIAIQANSTLTLLFWQVGKLINQNILGNKRAHYGQQIVPTLAAQLETQYGRSFNEKNVRRMMQFAEQFQDDTNVATPWRHLSWSHIRELLPLKTQEAKLYYANLVNKQTLGVRGLIEQIKRKAYERTAIANAQIATTTNNLPFNAFKDPYILDFLQMQNTFLESDLEQGILRALEAFILEMGKGFAFLERQKRMIIDGDDFYLDLLFYSRNLKRLVAIELKIGKFEAAFKGQMELYLKWLNKYEKQDGENEPIGLILCAETNKEQIELLEMHKDGIMVAEYWTAMPPKALLEKKLHQLLIEAQEKIARSKITQ